MLLVFLLFALAYSPLMRVEKIVRLEKVTSLLLEHFADQGIQVFPVQGLEEAQGVKRLGLKMRAYALPTERRVLLGGKI
ncbi:MAG: hypothetical protein LH702_22075 [Phormidesmis sp. CAN_BIN44]|nr:hypothetical protein [Phormidesmis sp. CAN_BIN44]